MDDKKESNMNIMVTGATGFIGSHLCRELVRKGSQVFALSHSGRTHNIQSLLSQKRFHLQTGDIRDVDMVQRIIKDNNVKVVFHLAAQLPDSDGFSDPFSFFDVNARGTLNILNAAHLGNVDRFIYASTLSVYSEPSQFLPADENHPVQPFTIYGATKLAGELCCNPYSNVMDVTMLRYGGVYGLHEYKRCAVHTFISQALNNKPITIHGDGSQTSDYIYIDDVIQGTLLAWEKNQPGVYNIGSGEETSVIELARRIVNLAKSKSEITLTSVATERPFRFVLDITKAQNILGYSPRSIDEGLRAHIKEFNSEV